MVHFLGGTGQEGLIFYHGTNNGILISYFSYCCKRAEVNNMVVVGQFISSEVFVLHGQLCCLWAFRERLSLTGAQERKAAHLLGSREQESKKTGTIRSR